MVEDIPPDFNVGGADGNHPALAISATTPVHTAHWMAAYCRRCASRMLPCPRRPCATSNDVAFAFVSPDEFWAIGQNGISHYDHGVWKNVVA